ncbi:MAG: hypothetical protein A3K19_05040 [Lentisphaerae bacterium RIFOXYB12_FULL_65_16]|nr:MAG: hypothetical protein A3K18_35310 [Lentisphaerae bacterium RIFOXYA12_64_32]OGV89754.1 MAG: hypothetical protein A3K19_05040 [Lentisphaerae bacterium RIFOXYB12_FULL_65_16]
MTREDGSKSAGQATKHGALARRFRQRIRSGALKPDQALPSEPKIARDLGVSRNTIRQAMRDLEHEGLIYRVQGKGTFVRARGSVRRTVALVLHDIAYTTHPFTSAMIRGLGEALENGGYSLDILPCGRDEDRANLSGLAKSYDGFLLGSASMDKQTVARLIAEELPFVFVKNYLPDLKINAVLLDYVQAGRLAAEHLIGLGNRQIGLIYAGEATAISRDFRLGVETACTAHGLTLAPENIHDAGLSVNAIQEIIPSVHDVTGLIIMDDELAVTAIQALAAAGKTVPRDMSVVGCNDMLIASMSSPKLTTVRLPVTELGRQAASRLMALIEQPSLPSDNTMLEPELVVRESTARPRKASAQRGNRQG